MKIKLVIITFIIIKMNCGHTAVAEENSRSDLAKFGTNVQKSIKGFIRSVVAFFNTSSYFIRQFEARRRKIKKAFFKFIDESLESKTVPNFKARRYSHHFTNPEAELSTLILSHGYQIETHTVLTVDGYILTLHKVKQDHSQVTKSRRMVLFQHGIFGSSADWFALGKQNSLPYLMLRAGCEVWIANSRGNLFSRSHVTKTDSSNEFWDFSLHEIGMYDLSAIIDYIIDVSDKRSELIFVGHSSGCAALLILLSEAPRFNGLLKYGIFFAPVVFVSHSMGPLKYLSFLNGKVSVQNTNKKTYNEFIPKGANIEYVTKIFCNKYGNGNIFTCLRYNGKEDLTMNLTSPLLDATSTGGSEKILTHFYQMMKSGHFRKFDYGKEDNILKYGQQLPPRYNLKSVMLDLYFFTSSEDVLSDKADISTLINMLPKVEYHIMITKKGFSHIHFLLDNYTVELFYNRTYNLFN